MDTRQAIEFGDFPAGWQLSPVEHDALYRRPRVPPPGPLDLAVELMLRRVAPTKPPAYSALLSVQGWDGVRPPPAAQAARTVGRSEAWINYRLGDLRELLACCGPPQTLRDAIDHLAAAAPIDVAAAIALLWQRRVFRERVMHPAGVLRLARCARLTADLTICAGTSGPPLVLTAAQSADAGRLPGRLAKLLARHGVVEADAVRGNETGLGRAAHPLLVEAALSGLPAHRRTRAGCGPLTAKHLHRSLSRAESRHQRAGAHMPNTQALRSYAAGQPDHELAADRISLRPGAVGAARRRLTGYDRIFLDVLAAASPRTATFTALRDGLRAGGYADGSAGLIYTSPLLEPAAHGQYRLAGSQSRRDASPAREK